MLDPGRYYRATSLRNAIMLMRRANLAALADGDLTLGGAVRPLNRLVDMYNVPEMRRQERTESGLVFGAALTLREVAATSDLLPELHRTLTRAVPRQMWDSLTLDETLRGRHHELLREWWAALLALNASVEWHELDGYEPCWEEFERLSYTGHLDNGLIIALCIPALHPDQRLKVAYEAPAAGEPALVAAAALVTWNDDDTVESVRLAVCGASTEPIVPLLDWLRGSRLHRHDIASVVEAISEQFALDRTRPGLYSDRRQVWLKRCVTQVLAAASAP